MLQNLKNEKIESVAKLKKWENRMCCKTLKGKTKNQKTERFQIDKNQF